MIDLVDVRLEHPHGRGPLVMDASLSVGRAEVVLVVAAAGIGTSTLVAAALGEAPLAAGRIDVFGRDVSRLRRSSLRVLRRQIGVIPEQLHLIEDRSAQLNVAFPLEIDGVPRRSALARADVVLASLGLSEEASLPVECLSSSARQRVAVARALVREPSLILADQPTRAQDATRAERVCEALYDASTKGAAVVMFGRDPALVGVAARNRWRVVTLTEVGLRPFTERDLDALIGLDAPPVQALPDPAIPNVVPFPITARTAGAR